MQAPIIYIFFQYKLIMLVSYAYRFSRSANFSNSIPSQIMKFVIFNNQTTNLVMNDKIKKPSFDKLASNSNQKQQMCFFAKVKIDASTRKSRLLFVSNTSLYIIRQGKIRIVIPFALVNFIYVAVFSGDLLLVTHKDKLIIDNLQTRSALINLIKSASNQTKIQFIKATLLDETMQKCQYSTELDYRSVKYKNFEVVDLDTLKKQYKILSTKTKQSNPLKNYIFKGIMTEKDGWHFLKAKNEYNHDCIIKIYQKTFIMRDSFQIQGIFNERNAQQGISSDFVVNLRKAFHTRSKVCFEFNYFEGFPLSDFKRSHQIFKQKHIKRIIGQIVIGLGNLHQSGMAMINLQPKRFFVTNQGHILIHDLSFSCPLERSISSSLPFSRYHAPEVVKYNYPVAQAEVDWWGLGLLVIWMFTGKQVFAENIKKEELRSILQGNLNLKKLIGQNQFEQMAIEAREFVRKLLRKQPKDRIGSKNEYLSILDQPFFQGLDKKLLISREIEDNIRFQDIIFKDAKQILDSDQKCQLDDQELSHFNYNRDLDSQEQQTK